MEKLLFNENRVTFDIFKSNICHLVKHMGNLDFIKELLQIDIISEYYYNRQWYPEALYLLAMLDYLSKENGIPICTKYNSIRAAKLSKTIYPTDVIIMSKVLKSDEPLQTARKEAIPEFLRFNIIESDIRNVVKKNR